MVQRKFYRQTYQKSKKTRVLGFLLKLLGALVLLSVFVFLFLFIYYSRDLPRPEKFTERQMSESTKIYDRTGGVLLYEIYGGEKRTWVPLEKIPDYLKKAVIAAEDQKFYEHFGIDFKGIARAILINFRIKQPIYGGSTIPQQLIRSTFLSNEKTIGRKIKEIILSLELDHRYSKEEILEWYLNQIPWGSSYYGAEAASQGYFRKSVSDISLAEAATLAALIKAPSYLSPYREHKDELLIRKDYILEQMKKCGHISETQEKEARGITVEFAPETIGIIKAPHFSLYVKKQLENEYGEEYLKEKGLRVYTSLDWELQKRAEEIIKERAKINQSYNAFNASLVALNPKNGEILAMVGSAVDSADYPGESYPKGCVSGKNCLFDPQFNAAVGTKENPGRQPGSAFKPFIYVTAFKGGYAASAAVTDEKTNFGLWGEEEYVPQNYDGRFRGLVTLRQGLAQSLNIPSIKVLYLIGAEDVLENLTINNFLGQEKVFLKGLEKSIETAKEMGITTLNKPLSFYGPAIVLGGGEVGLLDITSAYGVFATEGLKVPPVSILKIEDWEGNIIKENKKTPERVLEKEPAKIINDILSDNEARTPTFGPRSALYFGGYQVAAKTGTTQNYRDGWTIGYAPSIVVGVWVGNNDNSPMKKEPGVIVAGPIWHQFMEFILKKNPKEIFSPPKPVPIENPS